MPWSCGGAPPAAAPPGPPRPRRARAPLRLARLGCGPSLQLEDEAVGADAEILAALQEMPAAGHALRGHGAEGCQLVVDEPTTAQPQPRLLDGDAAIVVVLDAYVAARAGAEGEGSRLDRVLGDGVQLPGAHGFFHHEDDAAEALLRSSHRRRTGHRPLRPAFYRPRRLRQAARPGLDAVGVGGDLGVLLAQDVARGGDGADGDGGG